MNKKTLFFSNIVGNIMEDDITSSFNNYMEDYLKDNLDNSYSMVFIDAPGLGGEENYLPNVIRCFETINIKFQDVIYVSTNTTKSDLDNFLKNNHKIVYFLMGGNPYTQNEIINKLDLSEVIKNHNDLVIGFCAGAINLSKYSIITSDEDFPDVDIYNGLFRENIVIEPHYNNPEDNKRNSELKEFSNKLNTDIYCIPDESIIYFENGIKTQKGNIFVINNK